MSLDDTQQEAAETFLRSIRLACPICRASSFRFGDIVYTDKVNGRKGVSSGCQMPMLQVACNQCHHVILFAAKPLGLID